MNTDALAPKFIKSVKRKYLVAFLSIGFLLLLSQVFIQYFIYAQKGDAEVINIAGRQRMLSQKIVKLCLMQDKRSAMEQSPLPQSELKKSQALWEESHRWLLESPSSLSLQTLEIRVQFDSLITYQRAITEEVNKSYDTNYRLNFLRLSENEARYLLKMDQIVKAYEISASSKVQYLSYVEIGIFLLAVLLMGIEFRWVFKPILKRLIDFTQEQSRHIRYQKKLNKELLEAYAAVERAENARTSFLAKMSHEMLTPMNGILGGGELLSETLVNQEQEGFLDIILSNSTNLLHSINNILKFSELSSSRYQLQNEIFRLDKMLEGVYDLFLPKAMQKGHEMRKDWDFNLAIRLMADRKKIEKALTELIANAIQFNEKCIISIKAQKLLETDKEVEIRFHIIDDGKGIKEENQAKIFEAFSQEDNSYTRKHDGIGIGLNIAQVIVQIMGSHIELKSAPNQGSDFYFTLRLDKAREEEKLPLLS